MPALICLSVRFLEGYNVGKVFISCVRIILLKSLHLGLTVAFARTQFDETYLESR